MYELHYIEETDSTSNRLKQMLAEGRQLPDGYTLYTFYQSAGRGQAGNSWESERGKNLLFSTLLRSEKLKAAAQFNLSMLVSLAIANIVLRHTTTDGNNTQPVSIKWPNDIYAGDRKLAGILIENQLSGEHVHTSVAGIGINVNQQMFLSDAPNPVSLCSLTGKEYDLHRLMQETIEELHHLMPLLQQPQELKSRYMSLLYRATGWHKYAERQVSTMPTSIVQGYCSDAFEAETADIDNSGRLCLRLRDGSIRCYHFKEIRFVI